MKKQISIYLFLFSMIYLTACYEPQIETFADYRKEFALSLKNLHAQVENIEKVSYQAFTDLGKLISSKVSFEQLYKRLPVRVQEIRLEFKIVEDKLFYVEKNVDKYFEKLEEASKSLSKAVQKQNKNQEKKWNKLKDDILAQIKHIEELIKHTEDLRRLLVLADLKNNKGQLENAILGIRKVYVHDLEKLKKDIEKAFLLIENTKKN